MNSLAPKLSSRRLLSTMLTAVATLGLGVVAHAQPSQSLTAPFEVVIAKRGGTDQTPMALIGTMQMTIYGDGSVVGKLVQGTLENGATLPAIVFRGNPLLPDLSAPSVSGLQIGFVFDLGTAPDGNPMVVGGVGVTRNSLLELGSTPQINYGWALGKAVGPLAGDEGTWSGFVGITPPPGGSVSFFQTSTLCATVYNADGSFHCRICQTVSGSGQ